MHNCDKKWQILFTVYLVLFAVKGPLTAFKKEENDNYDMNYTDQKHQSQINFLPGNQNISEVSSTRRML